MLIIAFLVLSLAVSIIYVRIAGFVVWKAALLFAGCFLALNVLYLLVLAVASLFFSSSKPIAKQSAFCRGACVGVSSLATGYCLVRAHVSGKEKLPKEGRFLMVSNHRSGFDALVVIEKLREYNVSFISKISNMAIPVLGRIAHGAGYLSLDRENNRKALETILTAVDYLKRGICSMMVYPEGSRTRTGEMLPFHHGSFKIAQKAGVPLVIASVRGSEKVLKNIFKGGTDVYLDILEVVPAERVREMSTAELADYSRSVIAADLAATA